MYFRGFLFIEYPHENKLHSLSDFFTKGESAISSPL